MHLSSASLSITGRRSNNEDSLCSDERLSLFAVADGLGGYDAGEVASALAVEQLRAFVERCRRDPEGTWPRSEHRGRSYEENLLSCAALEAHRAISDRKAGTSSQMGSTLAAVLVSSRGLAVVHVGDSRVYRLRGGRLEALTEDHSVYAQLRAGGADVPPRHLFQFKNQITRALGLKGDHEADTALTDLRPGDRLLLCTDGLYDPFTDEALVEWVTGGDAKACCHRLVDAAFQAGSHDNITAVVIDVA